MPDYMVTRILKELKALALLLAGVVLFLAVNAVALHVHADCAHHDECRTCAWTLVLSSVMVVLPLLICAYFLSEKMAGFAEGCATVVRRIGIRPRSPPCSALS